MRGPVGAVHSELFLQTFTIEFWVCRVPIVIPSLVNINRNPPLRNGDTTPKWDR